MAPADKRMLLFIHITSAVLTILVRHKQIQPLRAPSEVSTWIAKTHWTLHALCAEIDHLANAAVYTRLT
jgi:hypothetical protein